MIDTPACGQISDQTLPFYRITFALSSKVEKKFDTVGQASSILLTASIKVFYPFPAAASYRHEATVYSEGARARILT